MQLNIAILGTRGIPNNYGGFEYVAACLAKRLTKKLHKVTVYNSSDHPYKAKEWNGAEIVHCFDPEKKIGTAGQFVYDLNCIRHARKRNYDIILMLGYTSSSMWGFLFPKKAVIITNMDGLEWQRTKYGSLTKRFLKYAEKIAVKPGRFYIADSPVIKKYLDDKYKINSKYIAYGATTREPADEMLLKGFSVSKHNYYLLMARIEPENNIEMILDGFCLSAATQPFIVIGNINNHFGKYLTSKYKNNSNIIFIGAVYDEQKAQSLTAFCTIYFHGHSVGGTNPSLLAAMAEGAPIAAHDNPFNRAVLQGNAAYFSGPEDISTIISTRIHMPDQVINNRQAIENLYNWPLITDEYEAFFKACHRQKFPA